MRNILVLTPIYPGPGIPASTTPVVHYFTREWVKLGYNVKVVNYPSNFPFALRMVGKLFHSQIESILSCSIRTTKLEIDEYVIDNVQVIRFPLKKTKPHSRYNKKQIDEVANKTIDWCVKQNFNPEVIIGHWTNPQVEIMGILKAKFSVPTCLIMHDAGNDFQSIYSNDKDKLLGNIDVIGYRSNAIKQKFESKFGYHSKWLYCYSGIPENFLHKGENKRSFDRIKNFIYVGMMIKRKYPTAIINALDKSCISDYTISYIGSGEEQKVIKKIIGKKPYINDCVYLYSRIPREEVRKKLQEADVFTMISRNETFGLVYLEAMAAGCITIASKNEGFDGVIIDGYNGFLCEAGNVHELAAIYNKIALMSPDELRAISNNAIATANIMTDKLTAKQYIEDVIKHITA